MNVKRDPDAILAAWLEDGPSRLPDATRRAIGVATRSTDQRRRPITAPWRLPVMNTYAKLALAAVVVVAVGAMGLALLRPGGSTGPGGVALPSGTPSVAPSLAPTATPSPDVSVDPLDTSTWTPYTSARYGYTMSHPASWSAIPADRDATLTSAPIDVPDSSTDHFIDEGASYGILVTAFAENVPAGTTLDNWLTRWFSAATYNGQQCATTQVVQPITIDGRAGKIEINDPCADTEAFVLSDGRVYGFGVWRENQEALFRAFLSTVHFAPGSTSTPAPTPVPFSSGLYGYRMTLPAGWSATPATIRWDGKGAPAYDDPTVDVFANGPSLNAFGFAGTTRLALNAYADDVIARTAQFHGDTCPDPPSTVESIRVAGLPAKFIAFDCGILINIVVFVDRGTGYEFVMRDMAVNAATDPRDRSAFDAILASVKLVK
jgi:hypothetical protein